MEALNDYAGLFALLALIATIVVPVVIYWLQKRSERKAMQDEYDAMTSCAQFPMSEKQREFYTKKFKLEKELKRK